ncbi:POU domain, class 6, transcription factor 2 [Lingula anatina]|uniref:POU domain protein n=1 Tax=Lingula anatina TaxID=7574 RepID=A0A1S3HQ40_LINAN|nr:POU domain, class 6, transcription factor 2 [Lingula anatina]|eukprot:XP_013388150.1 POU domain, class 6, transcription factor 2 [Lingula anatina]
MDGDTNDSTSDLNGELKPDPRKLAHSAIIKQDVMLSGTTTQSPVSQTQVFTLPTVSMPTTSLPPITMVTSSASDHMFMTVPAMNHDGSTSDSSSEPKNYSTSGISNSNSFAAGPTTPQLLSQAQYFFAASQPLPQTPTGPSPLMPMQQLLIPVSTGNGTQTFITIPISLAATANPPIQILTTSNGQLIATNLTAGLPGLQSFLQPMTPTMSNMGWPPPSSAGLPASSSAPSSLSYSTTSHTVPQTPPTTLPQYLTNAQGQIVAVNGALQSQSAAQPVVSNSAPVVSTMSSTIHHTSQNTPPAHAQQHMQPTHHAASSVVTPQKRSSSQLQSRPSSSPSSASPGPISLVQHQPQAQTSANATSVNGGQSAELETYKLWLKHKKMAAAVGSEATSLQQMQNLPPVTTFQILPTQASQPSVITHTPTTQVASAVAVSITGSTTPTINGLPANVSQLLPNTVSNATEGTTVDGINLDEIKEFAKQFKIRRLSLGLTQTQVGQALSATEGPSYSQSAICRFEKLDITPKSAQKIKPVLERWMEEAEERYKNGVHNLTEFIGSEPSKKRKRRTSFTPAALEVLNEYFERNTHPSGAEMTDLSEKLNYDREVIRVWFCNKRQALKNTIKKLRQPDGTP